MNLVEFKSWYANKRKSQYKDHYADMEKSTPGEVVMCNGFTDREWKKIKVSGKSTFNVKSYKAAHNRIWRYQNVSYREKFQYNN